MNKSEYLVGLYCKGAGQGLHQRVVMELKINLCLCRDVTGCSSIADRSHHSSVGDNDEPSATGNDHTNETGSDVTDGGVTSQCDGQPSSRSACNSTQTGWQQDCRFVTTSLMLFLVLLNDFFKIPLARGRTDTNTETYR